MGLEYRNTSIFHCKLQEELKRKKQEENRVTREEAKKRKSEEALDVIGRKRQKRNGDCKASTEVLSSDRKKARKMMKLTT
ncbi:Stress response protein NST1 [Frankliniella fusca]|uniref:Stress response protein NST1 n=1 Tax=Frankliniella fusca TaxID=407009 RepID=A0AAE1H7K5_9NEOP|nr:Stress response protein NST1 [Frankliniella fusca]